VVALQVTAQFGRDEADPLADANVRQVSSLDEEINLPA
jgi:hypothetical protein